MRSLQSQTSLKPLEVLCPETCATSYLLYLKLVHLQGKDSAMKSSGQQHAKQDTRKNIPNSLIHVETWKFDHNIEFVQHLVPKEATPTNQTQITSNAAFIQNQ